MNTGDSDGADRTALQAGLDLAGRSFVGCSSRAHTPPPRQKIEPSSGQGAGVQRFTQRRR